MPFVERPLTWFLWLGMGVASLFFFPLAATIAEDIYYLQWTFSNTIEFLTCWLVMSICFAVCLWRIDGSKNSILKLCAILVLSIIPLASFFYPCI